MIRRRRRSWRCSPRIPPRALAGSQTIAARVAQGSCPVGSPSRPLLSSGALPLVSSPRAVRHQTVATLPIRVTVLGDQGARLAPRRPKRRSNAPPRPPGARPPVLRPLARPSPTLPGRCEANSSRRGAHSRPRVGRAGTHAAAGSPCQKQEAREPSPGDSGAPDPRGRLSQPSVEHGRSAMPAAAP